MTAVQSAVKVYEADDSNGEADTATAQQVPASDVTVALSGTIDTTQAGTATYTVTYKGVNVGTVTVEITNPPVVSYQLKYGVGSAKRGETNMAAATGDSIVIHYADDTSEEIPVKLNMLSGSFSTEESDIYTGLTVTYGNLVIPNFRLTVSAENTGNDYPEFPTPGSVRVDKQLDTSENNWFDTGVAEIELSATGVPFTPGADVIFMLDTSSSMTKNSVDG